MQRRRFIKILASSAASLPLSAAHLTDAPLHPVKWHGYTLGAKGSITLFQNDRSQASASLHKCFAEIQRLEKIFSLYDHHSELSQLNRTGALANPSKEWTPLLQAVNHAHAMTCGLFDPTIQPLWKVYETHFSNQPDDEIPAHRVQQALEKTGWGFVDFNASQIKFTKPEMQLTLNGIAQGFITDRVTKLLRNAGYLHVLVELGETSAIGKHPQNRPWNVGIKDANNTEQIHEVVELTDQALATSGSYGSTFTPEGDYHHLIHPKSGRPQTPWKSLSVIAPTATEADALSTGLSFASEQEINTLLRKRSDIQIYRQV